MEAAIEYWTEGTGVANNGSCQIAGGATAFFSACMIKDSLGHTTTLGGAQVNNLTFPAVISFGGPPDFGQTFQLEFVSMQGSSNTVLARTYFFDSCGLGSIGNVCPDSQALGINECGAIDCV
jgi:hypothetical protein